LGDRVHSSTLAEIPERLYNTLDRERAIKRFEVSEAV
jgi:hypothetical protein